MGQVKARQVKKSKVEESIARAIELYKSDKKYTLCQVAESEGLALSTLYGRLKGRQSRRKVHEVHQILSEAEECSIVREIEDMDHWGFPMRVDHVREIAIKLLDGDKGRSTDTACLVRHWITQFLNRNQHLASKFRTQVKKQWIVSSNPKILKQSFEVLSTLIKKHSIQPYNIYNMDEKGLQMGKSA